jgi:hypothetical protein
VASITSHPSLITLAASELFFVVLRSGDISILCKSKIQRSNEEQAKVSRGLMRSLVLELLVFVPASAALLLLLLPLIKGRMSGLTNTTDGIIGTYAFLGLVSYGFPFALLRTMVTRIALSTLREFAALQSYDKATTAGAPEKVENIEP